MRGLMMDVPLLVTEIIQFADLNHPETEIVSVTLDNPRHLCTLADVFRRARQLANALTKAGVKPGDRIATLAWNDHRHLELYYAVSCIGAVLHTLNPRLYPEQIVYIANHAGDRMLFADLTLMPLVEKLRAQLPKIERVFVLGNDSYEPFIAGEADTFDWPDLDERTASALCYTSGTTGHPKGVLYDQRSTVLHSYGSALVDVMGFGRSDCLLAVVLMKISQGLLQDMMPAVAKIADDSAPIIKMLREKFEREETLELIEKLGDDIPVLIILLDLLGEQEIPGMLDKLGGQIALFSRLVGFLDEFGKTGVIDVATKMMLSKEIHYLIRGIDKCVITAKQDVKHKPVKPGIKNLISAVMDPDVQEGLLILTKFAKYLPKSLSEAMKETG